MLKNYFKTAYRNLFKKKAFSLVNILGLSIGIVTFLFIVHYANYEKSFDQFHEHKDSIYRLAYDDTTVSRQIAVGRAEVVPLIRENFSQIKSATHFMKTHGLVSLDDVSSDKFEVQDVLYTDNNFFEIFSSKLISGSSKRLGEGGTAVITRELSTRIFGSEDPIGKVFEFNDKNYPPYQYEVVALVESPPVNSHFSYNMLLSIHTASAWGNRVSDLDWTAFYSYLLLKDDINPGKLELDISKFLKTQGEYFRNSEFFFQSLTGIHLNSNILNEFKPNGDIRLVRILIILALVVLIVAYINYINLSTARSAERAKEVGIRKVMGSTRGEQIGQFLTEAFVLNLISIGLSLGIVYLLINPFNSFAGIDISGQSLSFSGLELFLVLMTILLAGSLISGFYPAFVLSGFRPVSVLKGKFKTSSQGVFLRKGLVTFQLAVSLGIIAFTLVIYNQVNYMRSQDLGFDINQVLVFDFPNARSSSINQSIRTLREDLKNKSSLQSFTTSDAMPSSNYNYSVKARQTFDVDSRGSFFVTNVDENYFKHYKIELLAGREFSEERGNERGSVIINRSSSALLGFAKPEDAILKNFVAEDRTYTIVGVAEDYHHKSLQQTVDPIIFEFSPNFVSRLSIRFSANSLENLESGIDEIELSFKEYLPGFKPKYYFLDDQFNSQYKADQRLGSIFLIFALLSLIIGCLGLSGLASFSVLQKSKEIVVRKVLGASTSTIITLLSKEYLKMIAFASLLSLPLSYFITQNWLNNYSEKTEIGLGFIIIPIITIALIAFFAIGYHIINAAKANPAQKLRTE